MKGLFCVLGSRVSLAVFAIYATVLITDRALAAAPQIKRDFAPEYTAQIINPNWAGGLITPHSMSVLLWGSDGAMKLFRKKSGWTSAGASLDEDLSAAGSDDEGRVIIAVGTHGTLVRSEDGGRVWSRIALSSRESDLQAVMYLASARAWWVAGSNGALLRSLDQGKTWKSVSTGLTATLQTFFSERNRVWVGGTEGVVGYSNDAGESWQFTKVDMPEPATPINSFRRCGKRLIAPSALGRIAVSDDNGQSWSISSTGTNAFFTGIAWDSQHGTMALASHTGHLFVSADECRTWQKIAATENSLTAIRYDGAFLAVGSHGAVLRSSNGGTSWQKMESGVQADLQAIAGNLIVGNGGVIAESPDNGQRWNVVTPAVSYYMREVVSLPGGDVIVASGELGSIMRSEDSGASWQSVDIQYPNMNTPPNLRTLLIEPRDGGLIAAGPPGTIIRSADQGKTWSIRHWTPLESNEAFPWSFADSKRRQVFVLEARGSVYQSNDGGVNWEAHAVPTSHELWSASGLAREGVYIAAGQSGALSRSMDGGFAWTSVASGITENLYGSFVDETTGRFFVLGAQGGIWRSSDRGLTWKRCETHSPSSLRRMMKDPRSGGLIAFGEQGALLRSQDAGDSWSIVSTGTDAELRKGILEHKTGNMIVLGQQGVVLRSTDGGLTWAQLASHTRRAFRSAVVNERNGDIIAVGERIVRFTSR